MVETQRRPLYRHWWFWLLAGLVAFLLGYLVGRSFTPQGRINPLEIILISEDYPEPTSDIPSVS